MAEAAEAPAPPADAAVATGYREVKHEYSLNFPAILTHLGSSLLVSTYQAGKMVAVSVYQGALNLSFHNFERAMGMAVRPGRIAVGAHSQIWFLRSAPDLAPRTEPVGQHDGCFLARSSHFTGDIHVHEMAWSGDELWIANTLFSCLCTLNDDYSFVPRWRPRFISSLAAEDRCHLNGLCLVDGQPKYTTAMAEVDTPAGWRPNKVTTGCLIDIPSGEIVARGFAMPHSPRVYGGRVWLLNSGAGRLVTVDIATGKAETVAELPGYTRGLALAGQFAFVGLSKIRETATFGGVPIAEQPEKLKCGVAIVDLVSGKPIGYLEFKTGVDEIFDVQVLPGIRFPAFSGPFPAQDGGKAIWTVPDPRQHGPSSEPRPSPGIITRL
jgi:uncharacterized protein (TIGR03032 family)